MEKAKKNLDIYHLNLKEAGMSICLNPADMSLHKNGLKPKQMDSEWMGLHSFPWAFHLFSTKGKLILNFLRYITD